jgi:signal transduction histidine kinase/CheY-like chemotaxis protein/PAS domain-containing protein
MSSATPAQLSPEMVERLQALDAISEAILQHPQQADLIQALLHVLKRILVVDNVAILLPTPDQTSLIVYTALGPEMQVADQVRVPIGQGVAGKIMATGTNLVVEDLAQSDVVNPMLREQMASLLGVPLRIEERIIGVLHVSTYQRRRFQDANIQLLELVANRIALALERVRAYEAVQVAHAQAEVRSMELETLFDSLADGVIIYDQEGRVREVNRVAQPLFATEQHRLQLPLGDRVPLFALTDEQGQPIPREAWPVTRILQGQSIPQDDPIEVIAHLAPNRNIELSCTGAPLRDHEGAITGGVVIWRDVTERRQTERHTQASLQALIQLAHLLIVDDATVSSESGEASLFAHIVELIHRLTESFCVSVLSVDNLTHQLHLLAAHGMPASAEVYWQEHREGISLTALFGAEFTAQLLANTPIILDMRHPTQRGRPNPYGANQFLSVSLMSGGQLYGVLSLARNDSNPDFTDADVLLGRTIGNLLSLALERKQTHDQRAQAEQALRTAQIENHRVQEATRLKSEFLANMSHELRTPLTGILGCTELLQRQMLGPLTTNQHEYISDILTSARHLLQLINDILDLSKIEAGKMRFFPEMIQLAHVVEEVCDIVRPMASSKQITLAHTIDPALNEVMLDPAKFKQVLYNFLSNGIKFTGAGGKVQLVAQPEEGNRFRIEVSDTGIGIAPSDLHKLFQAFQQLDASTAKHYAGTGLGLALTKQIVEAQGGAIGVTSKIGVGSRFWATLPCWSVPFLAEVTSTAGENNTILIVEDDAAERGWIAQVLAEAGYAYHQATTGEQALAMCHMHPYAAILLDLFLPDMNGWLILKALREGGPNQQTSVIVTSVATAGDITLEQPVQAILSKPLQRATLLAALPRLTSFPEDA